MTNDAWTSVAQSRLGAGVVLDSRVLYAMRYADAPDHERVMQKIMPLAERGVPLVVSSMSLAELARKVQAVQDSRAAGALVSEAWQFLNVICPGEEDLEEAAGLLAQGVALSLEEALAGTLARRLGCSIYGSSSAYHLFHVPVILD